MTAPTSTIPTMTTPTTPNTAVEDDVVLTVRIFLPTQLDNDTNRRLKRKFDDTSDIEFVLVCKPSDDLGLVWNRAEETFKRCYSRQITNSGYFSRMKLPRGADVFSYLKVGSLFKPGGDDNVLHIVQDPKGRLDSLPPGSMLRPKGFQLPDPVDDPDLLETGATKKRKVFGGQTMALDDISREMPIESNEQATEGGERHHEHEATEAAQSHNESQPAESRVDADGYRVPPIPKSRPMLPLKSRRTAQVTAATTTQATVLVQNSQTHAATPKPKPKSALEALWLKQPPANGRQRSMPINHSSPAEAAATRAKTSAPQPLQLNQAVNIASTFPEEGGIESNSGDTGQTLPTPTSGSGDEVEEEPTSAQPPPSSDAPTFSNGAHRFVNSRAFEDDLIIDDFDTDDHILREIDNADGDDDDDYVPDGQVKPRGRTRSRSLETIPPKSTAGNAPERPSSELPEESSAPQMADGTAQGVPTSTNAFQEMRSSQAARSSSSRRDTSTAAKWTREEDIALLKGLKAKKTYTEIKRIFSLDRSESSLRNRKKTLYTTFPGGKIPSTHAFYPEVEGNATTTAVATAAVVPSTLTISSTPAAGPPIVASTAQAVSSTNTVPVPSTNALPATSTTALSTASTNALPASSTTSLPAAPTTTQPTASVAISVHRKMWTPDEKRILWNAVAQGFEAKEIQEKHFRNRSEESVIKKVSEVFDSVVAREKKTGTFPNDSIPITNWTDQDNLKLRRAVKEGLTWQQASEKYFSGHPMESIRRKFAAYKAQKKTKTSDTQQNNARQRAADHSDDEEESKLVGVAHRAEEAEFPNVAPQQEAPASMQAHHPQPRAANTPNQLAAERRQQRQSPQVVVTPRDSRSGSVSDSNQLRRTQGNGGQTHLNLRRDKRKATVGPSGAPLRAQINAEYAQRSANPAQVASTEQNDSVLAAEQNDNSVPVPAEENGVASPVVAEEISNSAQIAQEEDRNSAPVAAEEDGIAAPVLTEESIDSVPIVAEENNSLAPVLHANDEVEVVDLRDAEDEAESDEFLDIDDLVSDNDEDSSSMPVITEQNSGEAPTVAEQNGTLTPVVAEESNREPVVAGETISAPPVAADNNATQVVAEEDSSDSSVPAITQENSTDPVVTPPYDLRTYLTEPDADGAVMIGRPEFPARFSVDVIETDESLWAKAMKLHKNRKGLAKTQYEIDWLGFQGYIASSGGDVEESKRLRRKILPMQRFLMLKERGTVPIKMNFADWVPDRDLPEGSIDGDFERDYLDDHPVESDFYDEDDDEGGFGAQLPDEAAYPHGVERDREFVEVEDDEDEEADVPLSETRRAITTGLVEEYEAAHPAEPQRAVLNGSVEEDDADRHPATSPHATESRSSNASTERQRRDRKRKRRSEHRPEREKRKRQRSKTNDLNRKNSETSIPTAASRTATNENNPQENTTQGWTTINSGVTGAQATYPSGFWPTVTGFITRTFSIPDAPVRRSAPPRQPVQLPYPDSEEDSSSTSSEEDDGN